jgi:bifunctional enzyme CysN/CysC
MKDLLKFITCGSVDDGKSTLIGHLLYDSKLLYADQVQALELDSRVGSNDGGIDYSLLLDGLMAEREQGITIDVAYRYFTTRERSFIVADCPGHEQYTRNMAVGASFADLAVILVDASRGVLIQTKRHARICAFMGIRTMVLAVNKMDLVGYDRNCFEEISREFKGLCGSLDISGVQVIPVSATVGDNITERSARMPWYDGPGLLEFLEGVELIGKNEESRFIMPVQRVCRPNASYRGFQGEIEAGVVAVGDELVVLPGNEHAKVGGILRAGKEVERAVVGEAVGISLDREIDISSGSVLCGGGKKEPECAGLFNTDLLWTDDEELMAGDRYMLKCGTRTVPASIMHVKHKVDINSGVHTAAGVVRKNDIVCCEVATSENVVCMPFKQSKALGAFILIDRVSNSTAACGTINFTLRRVHNLTPQSIDVTREMRARLMGQRPMTLWFTGLSGSGKSTLANGLEKRLAALGRHTMLLDGDNIRLGLNRDLGFTKGGRIENIRRVAEVAKLMNDAGLIVLTAFISPYEADRRSARKIIGEENFLEIYVSTPLEVCEGRDVKGLYWKARTGELPAFTGISDLYEAPENPGYIIDTVNRGIEESVAALLNWVEGILRNDA